MSKNIDENLMRLNNRLEETERKLCTLLDLINFPEPNAKQILKRLYDINKFWNDTFDSYMLNEVLRKENDNERY